MAASESGRIRNEICMKMESVALRIIVKELYAQYYQQTIKWMTRKPRIIEGSKFGTHFVPTVHDTNCFFPSLDIVYIHIHNIHDLLFSYSADGGLKSASKVQ